MTRTEIRRKANLEMEKRRQFAENEAAVRQKEIYEKFPQIEEIRRMLTQTASELSRMIIRRSPEYREAFAKIRQRNTESRQMITSILKSAGYPEDYLDVHYRCAECSDTGFTADGMCGCMKRLISKIASEELNRSANMPMADFAHFSLDYYRGCTEGNINCYDKMSNILDFCIKYCDSFSHSSKSLLMIGRTGVGKTHLSMSVAKEVIAKGCSVIYGSAVNLLRNVEKEHFGRGGEENGVLESLLECDLLIIDDLGSEFHSPFNESALYNIINSRMNMGIPTIISSNYTLEELYQTYNERIISRIAGYYEVLYFSGRDIRQQKRLGS